MTPVGVKSLPSGSLLEPDELAALAEGVAVDEARDPLADVQEAAFAAFLEGLGAAHLEGAGTSALDLVDFGLPTHGAGR